MLALAIMEGFERIELYGCDMTNMYGRHKTDPKLEKTIDGIAYVPKEAPPDETWNDERNCVNYWMGVAVGRGIEVVVSRGSRITKPIDLDAPVLYGYQPSKNIQKIRDAILADNKKMDNTFHSGKVTKIGNDTIIDLTDKKLNLSFFHKEDIPEGAKPGDTVAPKGEAYYKNEFFEKKVE